jgi:membrane protein YqaA with SNARE-associated domain
MLLRWRDQLRDWVVHHAKAAHARVWLAGLSFAESSFFPIPPDVLLIAMLIASAKRWVQLASITTIFSVLGGLFGYAIGALFFDVAGEGVVAFYGLEEEMKHVGELFADNTFMAIFLAAFTPIPFKVFTIAGGLFKVPLLLFVLGSLFGRGIRFFVIAFLMKLYGKRIGDALYKYFNWVTFGLLAVVLILFLCSM